MGRGRSDKHRPAGLALLRWAGLALTAALLLWYAVVLVLPYIHPERVWRLNWLGLSMPVVVTALLVMTVVWAVARQAEAAVTLAVIMAVTMPVWRRTVVVNLGGDTPTRAEEARGRELRIMSYNIEMFGQYEAADSIMDFIERSDCDVLCLQEFGHYGHQERRWQRVSARLERLYPYRAVAERAAGGECRNGAAIYSRFPIVGRQSIDFSRGWSVATVADLRLDSDTVRVITCHLESNALSRQDRLVAEQVDEDSIAWADKFASWRAVIRKLNRAAVFRAEQADTLSGLISDTRYPVVVAGDFNDVPQSYTYTRLLRSRPAGADDCLRDAYVTAGRWLFYHTYNRNLLNVPIDHVLLSPEFRVTDARIEPVDYSDHYPVVTRVVLCR